MLIGDSGEVKDFYTECQVAVTLDHPCYRTLFLLVSL